MDPGVLLAFGDADPALDGAVGGERRLFDDELFGKLVEDIARAFYVAGCTEAYRDIVLALRREREL